MSRLSSVDSDLEANMLVTQETELSSAESEKEIAIKKKSKPIKPSPSKQVLLIISI